MAGPRAIALNRADAVYGLPEGVAALWLLEGRVRRVFFIDHGTIVVGVRNEDMLRELARVRAAKIRRAQRSRPPVC